MATDELIARIEASPDDPGKWLLLGMLAQELMLTEARYTFRTGDGNRLCRHEKAVEARAHLDRLAALVAKAGAV